MINGIRYLTINTDASFKQGKAGLAWWIVADVSSGPNVKPLRLRFSKGSKALDNHLAELQAIIEALKSVIDKNLYTAVDRLVINTDSMTVINMINSGTRKEEYKAQLEEYLKLIKIINKPIRIKHVKGHTRSENARKFVNNWCDTAARQEMQKLHE